MPSPTTPAPMIATDLVLGLDLDERRSVNARLPSLA